jgi:hypothetical protein
MAYMNQETKAKIVAAVKPILKRYGVKGTFSVRNHSTIVLNIKSGKVDFVNDYATSPELKADVEKFGIQVNPYWFKDHFAGESYHFLREVFTAMKSAGWYDNSDAQTDYFDTAYYYDVNIGNWKKPYVVE